MKIERSELYDIIYSKLVEYDEEFDSFDVNEFYSNVTSDIVDEIQEFLKDKERLNFCYS